MALPLKDVYLYLFKGREGTQDFPHLQGRASWRWNLESFPPRWAPPSAHRRSKESKARRPFGQGCQRRSCRPRRTWKKIGGTAGGKRILLLVVIGGVLLSQYILHFGGRKRDRFFSDQINVILRTWLFHHCFGTGTVLDLSEAFAIFWYVVVTGFWLIWVENALEFTLSHFFFLLPRVCTCVSVGRYTILHPRSLT